MRPFAGEVGSSHHDVSSSLRDVDRCNLPIRRGQVLQARHRIDRGYYDDPAVLAATVDRLLQSGHMGEL